MAGTDDGVNRNLCPFLGTVTEEGKPAPCVDYPSFENMCFVGDQAEVIMLTDQATFCLSSGHRHCPRLSTPTAQTNRSRTAQPAEENALSDFSDPVLHAIAEMEDALKAREQARKQRKRRWSWIGAVALFVSTLLCGGMFAAYVGWRLVDADVANLEYGSVTSLAAASTPAPPPVYLIVTATSDAGQIGDSDLPAQAAISGSPQALVYPPAVTATAMTNGSPGARAHRSYRIIATHSRLRHHLHRLRQFNRSTYWFKFQQDAQHP